LTTRDMEMKEALNEALGAMRNQQTRKEAVEGIVVTQEEKRRGQLLAALDQLGSVAVGDESLVYEGTRIVLPEALKGPGGLRQARTLLRELEEQEEQKFQFSRTFPYRKYDGAAAFGRAMMRVFGTAGIGQSWKDMFGQEHLPQLVTIETGLGETTQVPWDEVRLPLLGAQFEISSAKDAERGVLSHIFVQAPRKHRARIEGFFRVLEDELQQRSIYRGKAVNGADDPGFFDYRTVDPRRVIYTPEVLEQLSANVWGIIDHAQAMRAAGIPLKRAFLVEGPWGTGKSLAGALTAQHAIAAGWTFILVRPQDDPLSALLTARLYEPAVVWIEDIDNLAGQNQSRAHISTVLDAMDNIAGKNAALIVGFTTNYVRRIEKAMMRPGRIDAVIHIGPLDREGVERLIRVNVPATLLSGVDYNAVAAACEGYVPAYVSEAAQRAVRYSIVRNNGNPGAITTEDLVAAASGLRTQLDLMNGAGEAADLETVDTALRRTVTDVITRTSMNDFGENFGVASANGTH
jgi:hypothetical protein